MWGLETSWNLLWGMVNVLPILSYCVLFLWEWVCPKSFSPRQFWGMTWLGMPLWRGSLLIPVGLDISVCLSLRFRRGSIFQWKLRSCARLDLVMVIDDDVGRYLTVEIAYVSTVTTKLVGMLNISSSAADEWFWWRIHWCHTYDEYAICTYYNYIDLGTRKLIWPEWYWMDRTISVR